MRWRATQQEIRKAYRQCVLKYHPDKMSQNATEDEGGEGKAEEAKGEAEDVSDIPKPVREVIEKMLDAVGACGVPASFWALVSWCVGCLRKRTGLHQFKVWGRAAAALQTTHTPSLRCCPLQA